VERYILEIDDMRTQRDDLVAKTAELIFRMRNFSGFQEILLQKARNAVQAPLYK